MEKFIVIEIQTNVDGTVGNIITAYNNGRQAESAYHTVVAAAALSELPLHSCVLMTNDGNVIEHRAFYRGATD